MARAIKLGANTVTGGPSLAQWAALEARIGLRLDSWLYMNGWGTVGATQPIIFTSQKNDLAANLDIIPCIAWQPTGPLSAVLDGSWNAYIDAQADTLKTMAQPEIWVRLAHEMNGTWTPYGNGGETPTQFIQGWQYVVDRMRARGVTNVKWVWSMTVQWVTASTADPSPYYPGDTYVDIVGMDGYNNLNSASWLPYSAIFGPSYDTLVALAPSKRFMVSEFGIGDDARGSKVDWIAKMLTYGLYQRTPRVEAIFFWDRNMPEGDYRPDSTGASLAMFQYGFNHPALTGKRPAPRLRLR